jgi:high-affinity nickel permease
MLSVFGTDFATNLQNTVSSIGTTVGPYILLILGVVFGIIVVTFIVHYIRARLGR